MKSEIKSELEELKSGLANLDNSKIYSPPEGYFDKMQKSILDSIETEMNQGNKVIKMRWLMGIAASLMLVFGVLFMINSQSTTSDALTIEDAYEYLDDNIESIADESLADIIVEENYDFDEGFYPDNDALDDYLEESLDDITEEDLEQIF